MSRVEIVDASRAFGQVQALDGVDLDIADGEFFGLLGPSGSGKTTLLRAIAGFVTLDSGQVRIDSQSLAGMPVHRRDIGMVFQNYALFPHLSVFDNVAFGLAVRGVADTEMRERIARMLALVQLDGLETRRPSQLSGGQQQRVALARALVTRPRVLLLDEPLGALDRRLREQMQVELRSIQREVGITTVFVTHDQEEALTLCDRIAIFDRGRIVQQGAPAAVYERPVNRFAATFLGDANFFEGQMADGTVRTTDDLHLSSAHSLPAAGSPVLLAVRPEKITLHHPDQPVPEGHNRLSGEIATRVYAGPSVGYRVRCGARLLAVFEQNRAAQPRQLGDRVTLAWAPLHSVPVTP